MNPDAPDMLKIGVCPIDVSVFTDGNAGIEVACELFVLFEFKDSFNKSPIQLIHLICF